MTAPEEPVPLPAPAQLVVDALRSRGWFLEIEHDSGSNGQWTVIIRGKGDPMRYYIAIDEDHVVSLNIDEEGIGGDVEIARILLREDAHEKERQIREISRWLG